MDKLLIIDGNSLLNRAYYALPLLTNSEGIYTNAVFGFCNMLVKIIQEQKPTHIAVALDYERKTFRNELYSEYKGTRHETPFELGMQFSILYEILDAIGLKTIKIKGIEADDIIGTLSKRFAVQTIILTGDRDALQLIDDTTEVWLTKKGISEIEIMDEKTLFEQQNITPKQVIEVKALLGDTSDNIPGVKGVGKISAYKLVSEYGDINNLYNNLDNLTPSLKNKLVADKEMAYLSQKLATIKTDCEIDCMLDDCMYKFPFSNQVRLLFTKYQFSALLKKDALFDEVQDFNLKSSTKQFFNVEQSSDLMKKLSKSKCVAVFMDDDIHICYDGESDNILTLDNDFFGLVDSQKEMLNQILDNENIVKVVFDAKDLKHKLKSYNIGLKGYFDSRLAQYLIDANDKALDSKQFCILKGYECESVALYNSYQDIINELKSENLFDLYTNIELPLIDVLFDMEQAGINIDLGLLKENDIKYDAELKDLTQQIHELAGSEFNINSPKQMGEVLYNKLGLMGNRKNSTAVEHLEFIKDSHQIIPLILRYRKIQKIKNTYIDSYLKYQKDGLIHTTFNQMATATGRLSSSDPNMQNIPARDDEAKLIREMFCSRYENGVMICADYNQIELKLMANFSKDPTMIEAFLKGGDIHTVTASKINHIAIEDVTPSQRRQAKAVNFGIIYGQGAFGLSKGINTDVKTAQNFIDAYFDTYPLVKKYMEDSKINALNNDCIAYTLFNRKRKIPELKSTNFQLRTFGERIAINTPLQGSASEIIKIAMLTLAKKLKEGGYKSQLVLQIHDELVIDAKKDEVQELASIIKDCMTNAIELRVPLTVDVEIEKTL